MDRNRRYESWATMMWRYGFQSFSAILRSKMAEGELGFAQSMARTVLVSKMHEWLYRCNGDVHRHHCSGIFSRLSSLQGEYLSTETLADLKMEHHFSWWLKLEV